MTDEDRWWWLVLAMVVGAALAAVMVSWAGRTGT